eukprot:1191683-Prorocentrum_minimum.AAC.4
MRPHIEQELKSGVFSGMNPQYGNVPKLLEAFPPARWEVGMPDYWHGRLKDTVRSLGFQLTKEKLYKG